MPSYSSTPMTDPHNNQNTGMCDSCGAVVLDAQLHEELHATIDALNAANATPVKAPRP